MRNVIVKLKEYYPQAQSLDKEIVKYVLDHLQETSEMTVYELAKETYTSPASVIRLCKKLGFSGYKDFVKSLIYELAVRANSLKQVASEITKADNIKEITDKITNKNIRSLEDTQSLMDPVLLDKAVDLLVESKNIGAFALGSSYNVARDMQQKFMRLNKHILINEDWHMQWLMARNMSSEDLGIIISYSGQTEEIIKCVQSLKENHVTTVSITRYGLNPIANLCDYNIFVSSNESLFRSGAMSSRIAQLLIIDILYTGYANRHYDRSLEMISRTHIKKETNHESRQAHHRKEKPEK